MATAAVSRDSDQGQGIGLSLIGLVVVSVLPLLLFALGVAWVIVDQQRSAIEGNLLSTARALRVAVDRELERELTATQILATSVNVDDKGPARLSNSVRQTLQMQADWFNVALIDVHSHQIVSSVLPLPLGSPTYSSLEALNTLESSNSPVLGGVLVTPRMLHQPAIAFLAPVQHRGALRYALSATMNTSRLSEIFAEQGLSPSWTGAVLDTRMVVAGRSRDAQKFVGQRTTQSLAAQLARSANGMFTSTNFEGARVYTVFSRSPQTGWAVALGVPAAEVDGPIAATLRKLALAGSALMAFALALAGLLGRAIVARRRAYDRALTQGRVELQQSLQAFSELVTRIPIGVYKLRAHQAGGFHFDYVSPRWCALLGVSTEAVERDPACVFARIHAEDRATFESLNASAKHLLEPFVWEGRLHGPEGDVWVHVEAAPTQLPDGDSLWDGILYDINERKQAEQRIEFLAYHDVLTGLPNRMLVEDRFRQAAAFADRTKSKVALLYLDLDNFKTVNDSLGHVVGDALIRTVAQRLADCVRDTDTISRQGGDEFVLLIPALHATEAIAPILVKLMASLGEPVPLEGHELTTSASIGITFYPDDGGDFEALTKKADMAMYRAKEAGRNTYRFFDDQMNVEAVELLRMRNGLRRALTQGEFILHYQPQIDLQSGALVGAEALIRWNHAELGMVPPARFIPIAEESGLIVPIGEWVLREACIQARTWQRTGLVGLTVAVNLSAVQFKRGDVEQAVLTALEVSGLDPSLLELELTESILIQDTEKMLGMVQRLKGLGVRLAIDDFGTGYSSLSYLKRFQVDKLKIDQSFVRHLDADADDAAIVGAIIQLAHSLGLTTIAEGVESESVAQRLRDAGCEEAQGYHYARPLTPAEFANLRSEQLRGPQRVIRGGKSAV